MIRVIKLRSMRRVGDVARMADEKCYYIMVGKPEGKRTLERSRRRWEDNVRSDLREIGWEGED